MHSGQSSEVLQQTQTPTIAQPRGDVCSQLPLTFSKDLNNEQVAQWLSMHPNFAGTGYQEDILKLRGSYILLCVGSFPIINFVNVIDAKINGRAFVRLDKRTLERFKVTLGFQLSLIDIIEELVRYKLYTFVMIPGRKCKTH